MRARTRIRRLPVSSAAASAAGAASGRPAQRPPAPPTPRTRGPAKMALYLVVHTPVDPDDETLHPPSRLRDLAEQHGDPGARPRWLRAWSPDLHDDRIFTL